MSLKSKITDLISRTSSNPITPALHGDILNDIQKVTETVDTIAQLKALDVPVGTRVLVLGYFNPYDGGGGVFLSEAANDLESAGNYPATGAYVSVSLQNVNYQFPIERRREEIGRVPDKIQFVGGAIWENNRTLQQHDNDGTTDYSGNQWLMDAIETVALGEKGFILPKVEGWRVIPTVVGYDNSWYWQRQLKDNTVIPEMYGGIPSDRLGTIGSGTDCTSALQACFESVFNVKLSGGSYYISSTVYLTRSKTVEGSGNFTESWESKRNMLKHGYKSVSAIWTDKNIRFIDIQEECHFDKISFDASNATGAQLFTSEILNYNMSFRNWGSSVERCFFNGPGEMINNTGAGGTAIRFNADEADNTISDHSGELVNYPGYVTNWTSRKLECHYMNIGHKIDIGLNEGTVSPITGNTISTWINTIGLDMTYNRVKQGVRWERSSINYIKGEYFQDGNCLTYEERDTPAMYLHCGLTWVDLGFGDQRYDKPQEGDSTALGGAVTYPREHYAGYNFDTEGKNISFIGRTLREHSVGRTNRLASIEGGLNNYPFVTANNMSGFNSVRGGESNITYWIENQLNYADKRFNTYVRHFAPADPNYDFIANANKSEGVLIETNDISGSYVNTLYSPDGLPTSFNYTNVAGTNKFTEIYIETISIRSQKILISAELGCEKLQFIKKSGTTVLDNKILDIPASQDGDYWTIDLGGSNSNSTSEIIIRLIGSHSNSQSRIHQIFAKPKDEIQYLPFVPKSGGTFDGVVSATQFNVTGTEEGVPHDVITRRIKKTISSAEILSSNTTPIVLADVSRLIPRSIFYVYRGGTQQYTTNTSLQIKASAYGRVIGTIDLSNLWTANYQDPCPIQVTPTYNAPIGSGGNLRAQTAGGDPVGGDINIRVVVDYVEDNAF